MGVAMGRTTGVTSGAGPTYTPVSMTLSTYFVVGCVSVIRFPVFSICELYLSMPFYFDIVVFC